MRIAGWVLLLTGFVLCLTVAWAALGFLLMGIGLVSLQVAERKRRKSEKTEFAALDARPKPATALAEVPPAHAETVPITPEPPPLPAPQTTSSADASAYDKEVWRRMVESDPDLARLAAVLSDYGQHYVDEFANSYLAEPDKGRLGAIVNEIIAKAARKESTPAASPEVHQASVDANREPGSPRAEVKPDRRAVKLHAPKIAVVPPAAPEIPTESNPQDGNDGPADDDLNELIKQFAGDAGFLRR